ncbi:hypothetical protein ROHU_007233 [Labeo rohita]|uniref:Uncharacterized protein n=1 Tax=Labeo rohita TaxID=84645 RepID=A0A498MRC7_LABRO|nr:hypothetical protein ROHU_007233 [Labeo rohita]
MASYQSGSGACPERHTSGFSALRSFGQKLCWNLTACAVMQQTPGFYTADEEHNASSTRDPDAPHSLCLSESVLLWRSGVWSSLRENVLSRSSICSAAVSQPYPPVCAEVGLIRSVCRSSTAATQPAADAVRFLRSSAAQSIVTLRGSETKIKDPSHRF